MVKDDAPCAAHDVRLTRVEKDTEKQWTAIEQLQKRLPVWATVLISVLTFALGCACTYASLAVRLAGR